MCCRSLYFGSLGDLLFDFRIRFFFEIGLAGRKFAQVSLKTVLSWLMRNYKLEFINSEVRTQQFSRANVMGALSCGNLILLRA